MLYSRPLGENRTDDFSLVRKESNDADVGHQTAAVSLPGNQSSHWTVDLIDNRIIGIRAKMAWIACTAKKQN